MNRWQMPFTIASGIASFLSLAIGLPAFVESSATWIVWLSTLADLAGGGGFLSSFGAVTLLMFLLGSARLYYLRRQRNNSVTPMELDSAEGSANIARHSGERVYVPLAPDELVAIGKGDTGLVADKLREPYLGKWIKVEGQVRDINRYSSGGFYVSMDIDGDSMLLLRFDERWGKYLETMGRDSYIVAHGKIDEIESYALTIEECELEDYGRVST